MLQQAAAASIANIGPTFSTLVVGNSGKSVGECGEASRLLSRKLRLRFQQSGPLSIWLLYINQAAAGFRRSCHSRSTACIRASTATLMDVGKANELVSRLMGVGAIDIARRFQAEIKRTRRYLEGRLGTAIQ